MSFLHFTYSIPKMHYNSIDLFFSFHYTVYNFSKWITVISNFLFRATQKINILNFGGKIMNIYDFNVKNIKGEDVSLADYKGKVVLIVNTASKCGFTPQYEGLEALYKKYKDQGLIILGFPSNQFLAQEPGSAEEVQSFCKLNFGVTFPLFAKTDVRGKSAAPLFTYLSDAAPFQGFETDKEMGKLIQQVVSEHYPENVEGNGIKWNFTKFLVSRDGNTVTRFEPTVTPEELEPAVKAAL